MFYIKEKNLTIALTRVLAMFLIILCHIIAYYKFIPGSGFMAQIFNVGVYVFFLISGYLYGNKKITNFKNWIKKRWVRISLPIIILLIIDAVLLYFRGICMTPLTLIIYALNLHGLNFIKDGVFNSINFNFANLGYLWFTTVIMICYLVIPIFQKIQYFFKNKKKYYELFFIGLTVFTSFMIFSMWNVNLSYFVTFYLGFTISDLNIEKNKISLKKYFWITIIMVLFQILRLIMKVKFDESSLYMAFVSFSHFILALWILISMFKLNEKCNNLMTKLANAKIVEWLDKNSYYIYLTHGLFCLGNQLNVYTIFDSVLLSSILFSIFTLITTVLLEKLTSFAEKLIFK